jgi:FdrA protein
MSESKKLLNSELRVVNLGLELFANDLRSLGVPVVQVDWRPPAGGDRKMASLLQRLQGTQPSREEQ